MSELIPGVAAGKAEDLQQGREVSEEGVGRKAGRQEGWKEALPSLNSGAAVCAGFKVMSLR